MIALIICTHSNLAEGLKNAAVMITQDKECIETICFKEGDDLESTSQKIWIMQQKYKRKNIKVVVFVDILNASPFNAAAIALAKEDVMVVSGVNLLMIVDFIIKRQNASDVKELLEDVSKQAVESIEVINLKEYLSID